MFSPAIHGGTLRHLDLSNCMSRSSMKTLPAEVSGLTSLTWLDVRFNQLKSLPSPHADPSPLGGPGGIDGAGGAGGLGNLRRLRFLDLTNNKLQRLPGHLASLPLLETLHVAERNSFPVPRATGDGGGDDDGDEDLPLPPCIQDGVPTSLQVAVRGAWGTWVQSVWRKAAERLRKRERGGGAGGEEEERQGGSGGGSLAAAAGASTTTAAALVPAPGEGSAVGSMGGFPGFPSLALQLRPLSTPVLRARLLDLFQVHLPLGSTREAVVSLLCEGLCEGREGREGTSSGAEIGAGGGVGDGARGVVEDMEGGVERRVGESFDTGRGGQQHSVSSETSEAGETRGNAPPSSNSSM